MIQTHLLQAIDALARCGTLTAAAHELHLTQPTLTRAMKQLEAAVGVPLFERGPRSIALNECGELVASYAARLLAEQREMIARARELDHSRTRVAIGFSDGGPMLELAPLLARVGAATITTDIGDEDGLVAGFEAGSYQLVVLSRPLTAAGLASVSVCTERLTYAFTPTTRPADTRGVRFADIDGEALLVLSHIGLWRELLERMLPNSRIIDEGDVERLSAVAEHSELPVLGTDLGERYHVGSARSLFGRTPVPVLDDAAQLEFFATCRERDLGRNPHLDALWELLIRRTDG